MARALSCCPRGSSTLRLHPKPEEDAMFKREKRVLLRRYLEQGVPKAEVACRVGVSRMTGLPLGSKPGQLDRELDAEPVR